MKAHFTSADLKMIAMGTMAIDHMAVAWIYMYGYGTDPVWSKVGIAMRLVGRMAFPLYGFLLVQGFLHTRNQTAYFLRVLGLAVISEIPFNLVVSGKIFWIRAQNTLVLLAIALLCLKGLSVYQKTDASSENDPSAVLITSVPASAVFMAAAGMALAEIFRADYGAAGILFILAMYWFRNCPEKRTIAGAATLALAEGVFYGGTACAALFFLNRYNGERGKYLGFFPYLFYPVHLLILYGAGVVIHGIHF